jgi:regulator of sirC expression with transglutaminase-like and TPR domain
MTSAKDRNVRPGAARDRAYILYKTKKDLAGAAKSLEAFLALIPQGQDTDRARALLAEIRRSGGTPKP